MTALIEYSREIMPMIRKLQDLNEELKEYKECNSTFEALRVDIKKLQEELTEVIKSDDNVKQMLNDIKDVSNDIKQALKAASKGTGGAFKPKQLKEYFFARAKEDGVVKVVVKGKLFDALNSEIDN